MVTNGPIREGDLPELLPRVHAVNRRGLIDFIVNGLQAGDVQQRGIGDALPNGEEHHRNPSMLFAGQHRFDSQPMPSALPSAGSGDMKMYLNT